jgi:acyl CoA:acetate/3-ketoacid CoA transferase alpha subunit
VAEIIGLREAVTELVKDGDVVALEGFTHLIPFAAAHEIVRQQRQRLTLVRMTPDLIYDQMIGMGCAEKLIFSWGGSPGVGSLRGFRDAVENAWPHEMEIEEHSHAGMASRYVAGASNLPFAVLRGYVGTDLPEVTSTIAPIACPFTGEELAFRTSVGYLDGGDSRKQLGYLGGGPTVIITDLGILRPDPETKELTLVKLHPGTSVEQVREATGWDLRVADDPGTTDPPTEEELQILRDLHERTRAANKEMQVLDDLVLKSRTAKK